MTAQLFLNSLLFTTPLQDGTNLHSVLLIYIVYS